MLEKSLTACTIPESIWHLTYSTFRKVRSYIYNELSLPRQLELPGPQLLAMTVFKIVYLALWRWIHFNSKRQTKRRNKFTILSLFPWKMFWRTTWHKYSFVMPFTRSKHLRSLLIILVRKKFISGRFFPSKNASLRSRFCPDHYFLNIFKSRVNLYLFSAILFSQLVP